MPDQQADGPEDPWDVPPARASRGGGGPGGRRPRRDGGGSGGADRGSSGAERGRSRAEDGTDPADDVPDTDEAGTGRRGAPRSDAVRPGHPVPDESPG
nr:hypothetical protein [Streptomyces sp. SID8352]